MRQPAVYAFIALVITLVVSIPAGYAMAMMEFRGRHALLVVTLVVMLMPATTLVVPLFLEVNEVHLIGTLWSVVLPYSFYPFGVYLTYIYFSTALPRDLLAAARIDGCTEFGAFRRIALPVIVRHHVCPSSRQYDRDRPPNAARRSGYDRRAVPEVHPLGQSLPLMRLDAARQAA